MKLITRQLLANEAARKWLKQYDFEKWPDKKNTYQRLLMLGDNPNPDEVDGIIGNGSWTRRPKCSECGKYDVDIVCVGEELDYESLTAYICADCAEEALLKLTGAK